MLGVLAALAAHAQTEYPLKVEKATVFLSGAELTSTAKLSFKKGENEFVFTNVANGVNTTGISVSAASGVVVESVTFQTNYLSAQHKSARTDSLEKRQKSLEEEGNKLTNKIASITEQLTILQNNRKVNGDNANLSVVELQKLLDLSAAKTEILLNQKDKNKVELNKIDAEIAAVNKQVNEERARDNQVQGSLRVKFFAKEPVSSSVTIAYVSVLAHWRPVYDVVTDDSKSALKFYYKANIEQTSGINWDDVHLTLSTGDPNKGMNAPVLAPWQLSFSHPEFGSGFKRRRGEESGTGEDVFTTDTYMNGQYQGSTGHNQFRAARASTMNDYVAVDNAGVNTSFDVNIPYTIPCDGKDHLVTARQYDVNASYEYFVAPGADEDVFLMARVTNWQELSLLSGKTNIFYEGTYVGQGYIDAQETKDTLNISMGRDKKIIVRKERDKSMRSRKFIGSNIKEEYGYSVTIRNTRKEPVNVVVMDQAPLTTDKDISIESVETGGAQFTEETGMMKWPLTLNPNETKTIKFGFTIKYPKGKTLANSPR